MGATPGADPPLAGTRWLLTSLRGQPALASTQVTLDFEAETVGGSAGCNSYGGGANGDPYLATPDGELALPMIASTLMACADAAVMQQEAAYLDALSAVDGYKIEGDTLVLLSAGEEVLTFARRPASVGDPAALAGTAWQLVTMDGAAPRDGEVWTLAFHDDAETASGFAGCRAYVAGYGAEKGELRLGGYLAMMGPVCDDQALLEREGAYTTMLGWVDRHVLDDGRLELHTMHGEALLFEPLPAGAQPEIEGTEWALLAFAGPNPQGDMPLLAEPLPGTRATATFRDGQVGGTAGCNSYGGSYQLEGAGLALGVLSHTKMACLEPEGLMAQEARYLSWLQGAQGARVYGTLLWVDVGNGAWLVLAPPAGEPASLPARLPAALEALAAYRPVADARPAVEALLAGIEDWLAGGGELGELARQLAGAAGEVPVQVKEAELTGGGPPEVVVRLAGVGLPLLLFVREGMAWTGYPLPADYAESVAAGWPVDVDHPWEGGQHRALRLEDLDGDGVGDVILTYQFAGASSTTAWVSAYRWHQGEFRPVFHADVVSWAAPGGFWLEPDPAGGQRFHLSYPYFLPGRYPKAGVHPRAEEVWRWDGGAGVYQLAWQAVGPGRAFWPKEMAAGDALLARGEYGAASDVYGRFAGDLDWQRAYLDDYELESCPLTSGEVGCRELRAWLDLAQLRQALALALDGEPAAAQLILSWVEITPDLAALAQAMLSTGGRAGGLFGLLAAYERQVAAGPGPLDVGLDRPAAVYQAYQPSPLLVQRALNWLAPDELPGALAELMADVDAPVESLTLVDLDGDGVDEAVWLSAPAWHALAPGDTPVGNWQQAWVAWLDGGRWQVTGIAAADAIKMVDITEPDGAGRRAVVLRLVDGEEVRQVALVWDGGMSLGDYPG